MPRKCLQIQIGNKIENNRSVSNYRHYRFILIRKQYGCKKITDVTDVTDVTVLIQNGIGVIMVGCWTCCVGVVWCGVFCVCVEMVVMCAVCGVLFCLCVYMWCCVLCGMCDVCVHVVVWCCVVLACCREHVVVLVVRVCVCGVWCGVRVVVGVWCGLVCVCECLECGTAWCAEKPPRAHVQHASVCSFKTPPCVAARRPHVFNMRASCRFTRRRFETTHGGVLDMSTGEGGRGALSLSLSVLASFFTSFSSSFFSLLFSLLSFFLFLFSSLFSLLSLFSPTNTV